MACCGLEGSWLICSIIAAQEGGAVPINVYLSVGRPFLKIQEDFVASIKSQLASSGLRARTVGRTEYSHQQPLRTVQDLMERCAGTVVLALERVSIESATERRNGVGETRIQNVTLPTPWNQIEAALAYSHRMPLLVLREKTIREEGLLEGRYDWYVQAVELDLASLSTAEFRGVFDSWCRDVHRRAGWFRYRR